jgi:hypothetical protein
VSPVKAKSVWGYSPVFLQYKKGKKEKDWATVSRVAPCPWGFSDGGFSLQTHMMDDCQTAPHYCIYISSAVPELHELHNMA